MLPALTWTIAVEHLKAGCLGTLVNLVTGEKVYASSLAYIGRQFLRKIYDLRQYKIIQPFLDRNAISIQRFITSF